MTWLDVLWLAPMALVSLWIVSAIIGVVFEYRALLRSDRQMGGRLGDQIKRRREVGP